MKTSELHGPALDWAVAKCERVEFTDERSPYHHELMHFNYSTDWSQGGPIIEREKITVEFYEDGNYPNGGLWLSTLAKHPYFYEEHGPTPLVAAMRCYVASQLGDEIEVPEELL